MARAQGRRQHCHGRNQPTGSPAPRFSRWARRALQEGRHEAGMGKRKNEGRKRGRTILYLRVLMWVQRRGKDMNLTTHRTGSQGYTTGEDHTLEVLLKQLGTTALELTPAPIQLGTDKTDFTGAASCSSGPSLPGVRSQCHS